MSIENFFEKTFNDTFSGKNFRLRLLVNSIISIGVAVVLIAFFILLFRAKESKENALENSKSSLHSITYIMAEHVRQSILNADIILRSEISHNYSSFTLSNLKNLQTSFNNWLKETPSISGIVFIDEAGKVRVASKKDDSMLSFFEGEGIENFEHFAIHKENPDLIFHISVFREYENDFKFDKVVSYVVISRRINKPDGSFGGVVLAGIKSAYIAEFFKSLKGLDSESKMLIFNSDLSSVLNINSKYSDIDIILKKFYDSKKEAFEINKLEIASVSNEKSKQLISLFKIDNFGLLVSVIYPQKEIYKNWHKEVGGTVLYFSFFVLFVIISCVFSVIMLKQFNKAKASEMAALFASQAKSDFLTNMSHELRTPLNAVIGFSDMMATGYLGQLNDKQKERINDISYCGQHLLSLINDILLFAKGEAGKIELFPEQIGIKELVADTLRIFGEKKRTVKNGLSGKESKLPEIIVELPESIPDIFVDKRKIKQVLLNLISNSAKFTSSEGIIKITANTNTKGELLLEVSDTGVGMSEDEVKTSLTTFGQVHKDIANRGTGIGLPLSKMLVELHDGKFIIQSSKNIGTKVTILVPAYRILWSQVKPSGVIHS